MTASRTIAETFYKASTERDLATIVGLLADNVDWMVQGPVMIFRRGVGQWQEVGLPQYAGVIARWQDVDPATASDQELLLGIRELAIADAVYWFSAAIVIGAAKVSDALLLST